MLNSAIQSAGESLLHAATAPHDANPPGDPTRQLDRIDALLASDVHPSDVTPIDADPIDLNSLIGRCLGDTGFCGIILHKFAARSSDQLASLERALASNNRVELADRAHALKGVALNVSANGLADRANLLEHAARQAGQPLEALVAATRLELERCVQAVPAKLQALQQEG